MLQLDLNIYEYEQQMESNQAQTRRVSGNMNVLSTCVNSTFLERGHALLKIGPFPFARPLTHTTSHHRVPGNFSSPSSLSSFPLIPRRLHARVSLPNINTGAHLSHPSPSGSLVSPYSLVHSDHRRTTWNADSTRATSDAPKA